MKIFCNSIDSDEFEIDNSGKSIKEYVSSSRIHDKRSVAIQSSEESFESFHDWCSSDSQYNDNDQFLETLESLLCNSPDYKVVCFLRGPTIRGLRGTDTIVIRLSNGHRHRFYFDWEDEQLAIYEYGPRDAAQMYYAEIDQSIKDETNLM